MKYWFDGKSLCGVMALRYKTTFVVYQTDARCTEIYFYEVSTVIVRYSMGPENTYYLPLKGSICLFYDGKVHYDYLLLKDEECKKSYQDIEPRFLCVGQLIEYWYYAYYVADLENSNPHQILQATIRCVL